MSKDDRPISDQLKQVVDELQLEERVKDVAAAAERAVLRGLEMTGGYLREHRADIEGFIDRAGESLDRQTSGRYADQIEQVRSQLTTGVASLTDRPWERPATSEPDSLPPPAPEAEADADSWTGSTDDV